MVIIGIEGVSCTGKTTLAVALAARLGDTSVVPCYYHCAPSPSALPSLQVNSEDEQLDALAVHLDIELLRLHRSQEAAERGCHVVLDRTVDTLLAHLRAVGEMSGLDASLRARALVADRISRGQAVVPDVTLLLQADHQVLAERARTRVAMPGLYYDPVFTRGFHTHTTFHDTAPGSPAITRLPALDGGHGPRITAMIDAVDGGPPLPDGLGSIALLTAALLSASTGKAANAPEAEL